jgi:hexosaminidase
MRLRILALLGLAPLAGAPAHAALPLIPQPQEIEERPGAFALGAQTRIAAFPAGDPEVSFAARQAAEELNCKRSAKGTILVGLPGRSPEFAAVCREADCMPDEALGEQGYMLVVSPERVVIAANEPAGAFYGVQTLLQLAQIGGGREIPCVRVRDWPALKWRGVLTDQSRQAVPKVETYKRMVRELSRYKINFVSMHLEHTFVVKKHPLISEGTGALTAEEAREICDYARQYHCLFFPSFEAFGHQSHIFKHPEYADLAESDWKYSFAPTVEGTYSLLADMFDEMCPAFTGTEFFNAGSDEVGDLGASKSKELADRIGKAALYAQHMNRVHDLLKARGKRMMMWGDMLLQHPDAMDLIPKDTIIMDWHYGPAHDYPSIAQFREKGFEVFVVPALSSWCRLFPDYDLALENMEWLIRRGREQGAIGSMTCNWGDDGNENLIANCYYGWLFAAECSWGAQEEEIDRSLFGRAFCRQFFGTGSDAPAQATHLLTEANQAISRDTYFNQRFFHDDPFSGQFRKSWPKPAQWERLRQTAEEARGLIAQVKDAPRNADVLSAMDYEARRNLFVADKAEMMEAARAKCQQAAGMAPGDSALQGARHVGEMLAKLRDMLAAQRDEFVTRWNAENRPEGIDYNLRRFDAQLAALDTHISALNDAIAKGALPDPRALDLDDRRFIRALRPVFANLPKPEGPWQIAEATARLPVRIEAGNHDRVRAPMLIQLPTGRVLSALHKPPSFPAVHRWLRARVAVNGELVATQVVPALDPPDALLAFVLPGPLKAGQSVSGELYLWSADGAAEPTAGEGLAASETDAGIEVRTSAYEALVGPEGAHAYTWKLTKLNGLDITQPGETGWAGFFDDPRVRTDPFELSLAAAGRVVAIVRAAAGSGYEKEFFFWAGLPYGECTYSDAAGMSWAFDSTANFAADSPMPGTAHLSNGFTAPVPASTETRQVPEGGGRAWWCCKTRADGLTLGLITPLEQTNMKVGPGGGWGGVGIEGSNPTQYFVVYCDVDLRGPAAVEKVYQTLARDDPITVTFGQPEARP